VSLRLSVPSAEQRRFRRRDASRCVRIRPEVPSDEPVIARIVERAFANHPHSVGTEVAIIRNLRAAAALSVSLVAEVNGQARGYVAASPVEVGSQVSGWYGLGPVAVDPAAQGKGVGSLLVEASLKRLRGLGASGCVVAGDPSYYSRLGFEPSADLT
jgi:putative acetyltransferase